MKWFELRTENEQMSKIFAEDVKKIFHTQVSSRSCPFEALSCIANNHANLGHVHSRSCLTFDISIHQHIYHWSLLLSGIQVWPTCPCGGHGSGGCYRTPQHNSFSHPPNRASCGFASVRRQCRFGDGLTGVPTLLPLTLSRLGWLRTECCIMLNSQNHFLKLLG